MKFSEGIKVRLLVDKDYDNGDSVSEGTMGKVTVQYPTPWSAVDFPGTVSEHRVPDDDLEEA